MFILCFLNYLYEPDLPSVRIVPLFIVAIGLIYFLLAVFTVQYEREFGGDHETAGLIQQGA